MTRTSRLALVTMLLATVGLAFPWDVAAQRAVPRGGARTGVAVPRSHVAPRYYRPYFNSRYYYPYGYSRFYYPYAYYPRYYYPYYSSFAFSFGFGWPYWGAYGYSPYGYSPYGYYPYRYGYGYPYPYAYPYYGYDNIGSARLQITPRHAQVFVDGRFVGLVDDFDGSFQRLRVDTGQHEVKVYLDGYRTFTQKVLFTPGTTVNLGGSLEPLRPGETAEPRPEPDPSTLPPDRYARQEPPPERYGRQAPPTPDRAPELASFGTLVVRVHPADAVIVIDGEEWDRPEGESRFSIDLPEGPHQLEVRKEGHRPYTRTVEVRRGRTFTVNVSLTAGGLAPAQARTPPLQVRRSEPTPR